MGVKIASDRENQRARAGSKKGILKMVQKRKKKWNEKNKHLI